MTNGWVPWLDGGQKKRISGVRGRRQITMDETISCLKAFPCCLCSTIHHPLRQGAERLSYFLLISHKECQQPPRYLFTTEQQEEKKEGGGAGGLLCVLWTEDKIGKVLAEIQRHSC